MNLFDFATIEEARAYTETTQGDAESGKVLAYLVRTGINVELKDIAATQGHALRALADAAVDTWQHKSVFGFSDPVVGGMLDAFVAGGLITEQQKTDILAIGQTTVYPFANSTEQDFQRAKGTLAQIEKTPSSGWLKITTSADCEAHRPQIYADIQGVRRRVAGFDVVEKAGDYIAAVPSQYSTLYVDNAYRVL